jgi:hypothetical protein
MIRYCIYFMNNSFKDECMDGHLCPWIGNEEGRLLK